MCSLTSELYGILATTVMLYTLSKHHYLQESTIYKAIITADNKQAIDMATTYTTPINISETQKPEHDIQHLIHLI